MARLAISLLFTLLLLPDNALTRKNISSFHGSVPGKGCGDYRPTGGKGMQIDL